MILGKYQKETKWPTHCEHDVLYVVHVSEFAPTDAEVARLKELGFVWDGGADSWASFRYGSA